MAKCEDGRLEPWTRSGSQLEKQLQFTLIFNFLSSLWGRDMQAQLHKRVKSECMRLAGANKVDAKTTKQVKMK